MVASLDRAALNAACMEAASTTVLQWDQPTAVPTIEAVAESFRSHAEDSAEYVASRGRDPNVVVRCAAYLARVHAIPPMGTDTRWFAEMLDCLIELAVPNTSGKSASEGLYRDIEEGIAESRADYT
jgi:hypothetical protein